jgi:hypothetical protein
MNINDLSVMKMTYETTVIMAIFFFDDLNVTEAATIVKLIATRLNRLSEFSAWFMILWDKPMMRASVWKRSFLRLPCMA